MDKEEFKELLKKANLTKKEFAIIIDMKYTSVNNWGSSQQFPRWVKSWLENYIEKQKLENMKKILKDTDICKDITNG
ncbi:MAG: acyl carrier protein [Arcobacter sp.]|nr:MAG: acyl carrier protein [Arcobacter sp.]